MTTLNKEKAFTLIELMIVVAILSIVSVIGLASFTRAQQNARDTQRKNDLETIRGALEQYYSTNNEYPPTLTPLVTSSILKSIPKDPKTNSDYTYVTNSSGSRQEYCLSADLETVSSPSQTCTISGTTNTYEFVLSPKD